MLTQDVSSYKCKKENCFNQYFDHVPPRISFEDDNGITHEMLNTHGLKLGAHYDKNLGIYICNLQYVMVYLLSYTVYDMDPNLVDFAKLCYLECRDIINSSYTLPSLEQTRLFLPTIVTYGNEIESPSTDIYNERFMAKLNKQPDDQTNAPKPGYPKYPKCMITADFDVTKSKYFQIDGVKRSEL